MLSRVGLLSQEDERQVQVLHLGVEVDSDLLRSECTRGSHGSYLWQGRLATPALLGASRRAWSLSMRASGTFEAPTTE